MNKQELIERYKTKYAEEPKDWKHPSVNASRQDLFANFIRDLEQLDEPQKPVVPKFVADWFEENKDDLDNAIFGYLVFWEERDTDSVLYQWFAKSENNPIETLIRMKDGYEVEKEPLYYVTLPDTDKDSEVVYALEKKRDGNIEISLVNRRKLGVSDSTKLSEQEIKSVDERYQLFAKEIAK